MINVIAGALAPEFLSVKIERPVGETLDLSTVESVALHVYGPGPVMVWPLNVQTQSSSLIMGKYEYALGNVDTPGTYRVMAMLALVGGGTRRAGPTAFTVSPI